MHAQSSASMASTKRSLALLLAQSDDPNHKRIAQEVLSSANKAAPRPTYNIIFQDKPTYTTREVMRREGLRTRIPQARKTLVEVPEQIGKEDRDINGEDLRSESEGSHASSSSSESDNDSADDDVPLLELSRRRKSLLATIDNVVDHMDERFVGVLEEQKADSDYKQPSSCSSSESEGEADIEGLAIEVQHFAALEADARKFEARVSKKASADKRGLMAAVSALRPAKWSAVRDFFASRQEPPKFAIKHNSTVYTATWSFDVLAADDGQVFSSPAKWAAFVGVGTARVSVLCDGKVWTMEEIYEHVRMLSN